ncbi:putative viral A-type inclusion protein, partial [Gregarina niphandrodes]
VEDVADKEAKLQAVLNERVQLLTECDQKQESQIKEIDGNEKKNHEEIEILKAKVASLVEHLEGQDDPADMRAKVDDIMEQIEKLAKRDETQQAEIQNVADKVEDVADKEAKLQQLLNERVQWLTDCDQRQESQIKTNDQEIEILKAKLESLVERLDGQADPADVQMRIDDINDRIEKLAKRDEVQQGEIGDVADQVKDLIGKVMDVVERVNDVAEKEAKLQTELTEQVQLLTECDQKQESQIKEIDGHEKKNHEEIEILKAKVASLVEHLEEQDDPADMQAKIDDIMEQS